MKTLYSRWEYRAVAEGYLSETQMKARNTILTRINLGTYQTESSSCAVCDSSQSVLLARRDTYGLPVSVVLCTTCGFIYNTPRLTETSLKRFYTEEYRGLDRRAPTPSEAFFALERIKGKRIFELLSPLLSPSAKSVLEVGCGAGGVLYPFQEHGYKTLGVDFNRDFLSYGKSQGLSLELGSIESVQGTFDVIIYEQALEHISDLGKELREISSRMHENSLLYIGVPGIKNIASAYGSNFIRYLQLPHLSHFELSTLRNLMGRYGFECVTGDETVRAVFKKTKQSYIMQPAHPLPFLRSLEHSYQLKRCARTLSLPFRAARKAMHLIAPITRPSPIPNAILTIIAHPDDESLWCGGTLARLTKSGVPVTIIGMTNGNNPVRKNEFENALKKLGATGHLFDFPDGSNKGMPTLETFDTRMQPYLRPGQTPLILSHSPHGDEHRHYQHRALSKLTRRYAHIHGLPFAFFSDRPYTCLVSGKMKQYGPAKIAWIYFPFMPTLSALWRSSKRIFMREILEVAAFRNIRYQVEITVDKETKNELLDCYPSQNLTAYQMATSTSEYIYTESINLFYGLHS